MNRILILLLAMLLSGLHVMAQSRKTIETTTDIAMFAPALVGAGVAL